MANAELATAWIRLQPSFRGLKEEISKEIDGVPTEKLGKETGARFTGGVSKGLAKLGVAVAAGFAVKKVADFFTDSLDAVKQWQVLNAQTAAVVQSTGGAANITAKQVHALAESLENQTATQAEAIQSGANMLLTFKNISNGVGEGNDIFNQATAALVDMARAMGTDPQQAAVQLGKALNDPIQGISALQRVGVQFTDDQKAVIRSLVETGETAAAQKIIIGELNDQFGGSGAAYADTYTGKLALLQDAFGDVGEEIVTELMPHLEGMIDWLNDDGMKVVEDFKLIVDGLGQSLSELEENDAWAGFVESLGTGGDLNFITSTGFIDNLEEKWKKLPENFKIGWDQIKEGNRVASDYIAEQFQQSGDTWAGKFEGGRQQINDGVTWMWEQITTKFEGGWTQISTWWNEGWDGFGQKLARGREQINTGVRGLVDGMAQKFATGWEQISTFFSDGWENIQKFMGRIGKVVDRAKKKFEDAGQGIRDAFDGIGQFLKDAFGPVSDLVGGIGNAFKTFFGGAGDRARHVKGKAQEAASSVGGGGAALARVKATLPTGLRVTDTLSNPPRDKLLGLQRSANSYHYDAKNPAVDIAGPTWLLDQYAAKLRAMGGWRQLLWRTAGHYDHIHVAHSGGVVDSSWYRSPGDKWDERTVRLQVGETVLPKGVSPVNASYEVGGGSGERPIYMDGSLFGVLREVANGEARIVLNDHNAAEKQQAARRFATRSV